MKWKTKQSSYQFATIVNRFLLDSLEAVTQTEHNWQIKRSIMFFLTPLLEESKIVVHFSESIKGKHG